MAQIRISEAAELLAVSPDTVRRWIDAGRLTATKGAGPAHVDGTDLARQKLERVLTNDPGMGVIRHVDAGYDRAEEVARERGVRIPMAEG